MHLVCGVNAGSLGAVVLAAGVSSRMGAPKALLPVDGVPAVLRVALTYTAVGVEPLVVLGRDPRPTAAVLDAHAVRSVVNEAFADGMYSSVRRGVRALPDDTRAFFVHPVDCALVRTETVALLARTARMGGRVVLHPTHAGRRGHPPLLPLGVKDAILAESPEGGLRGLLEGGRPAAVDVSVDDPNVLLDMDDPGDHARLEALAVRERLPGPEACHALLVRHRTPAVVVAHAVAVAGVAVRLGAGLRAAGVCLDLRLLEAAALTHDIARDAPRHAAAGAAVLESEGFPRVAAVVRHHMQLAGSPPWEPGEAEILYLADKLTVGAKVAGLAAKRRRAEELFFGDTAALAGATARLDAAQAIAARVEALVGGPLAAFLTGPAGERSGRG